MNVFKLFAGSLHNAEAYRHMRKTASFGMGYALVLVMLCTLVVTVYFGNIGYREFFGVRDGRTPFFDDMVNQIASQVPVMTLKDHHLVTADPVATTIKLSGQVFGEAFTDIAFITIDTTGATTYENMPTPVVITADNVLIKGSNKTEIKSLKDMTKDVTSAMVINRAVAEDAARSLNAFMHEHIVSIFFWIGAFCWLIFVVIMYILRVFMLLILGLIGLVIGSVLKSKVSYAESVSLASLSYTPVALLDTVLFAFVGYAPSTLALLVAGSVALFAAIKASTPPQAPQMIG